MMPLVPVFIALFFHPGFGNVLPGLAICMVSVAISLFLGTAGIFSMVSPVRKSIFQEPMGHGNVGIPQKNQKVELFQPHIESFTSVNSM